MRALEKQSVFHGKSAAGFGKTGGKIDVFSEFQEAFEGVTFQIR